MAIVGSVAMASAVFACADLFGFKTLEEADTGTGADVQAPDTGFGDADLCDSVVAPGPPQTSTSGTANDFTFALRHVYFTTSPDGGTSTAGFNLDSHCTTNLASDSCMPPPTDSVIVDGPGGVDNESVALVNTLITVQSGVAASLSDPSLNTSISNGDFTLLLRLLGYRGGANQASTTGLTFSFQSSPGAINVPPSFDGGDNWLVNADDVVGGLDSGSNFPNSLIPAYVTNNVLTVVYSGTATLHILVPQGSAVFGPLTVIIRQPVLTATIVPRGDGRFDLANGVVGGRWAVDDMLQAIGLLNTTDNEALCNYFGGLAFPIVATSICGGRDISKAGTDNDTVECDAISVAIAFDAVAATVANTPTAFPTPMYSCADAATCTN
jgi:hypothetical protein